MKSTFLTDGKERAGEVITELFKKGLFGDKKMKEVQEESTRIYAQW